MRRFLRRAKLIVGDYPSLMPIYLRLTHEGTSRRLTSETALVLEGFPRSGNTFTAASLRHAQSDPIVMTTHVHNIAILKQAIERKIPTLLVVRHPVDCLASYLVWNPKIGASTVLWEYIHYHERTLKLLPHLTVATFDQLMADPSIGTSKINARFGTSLSHPSAAPEFQQRVTDAVRSDHKELHPGKDSIRVSPTPTKERAEQSQLWRKTLRGPKWSRQLKRAEDLYTAHCVAAGVEI